MPIALTKPGGRRVSISNRPSLRHSRGMKQLRENIREIRAGVKLLKARVGFTKSRERSSGRQRSQRREHAAEIFQSAEEAFDRCGSCKEPGCTPTKAVCWTSAEPRGSCLVPSPVVRKHDPSAAGGSPTWGPKAPCNVHPCGASWPWPGYLDPDAHQLPGLQLLKNPVRHPVLGLTV